MINLRIAKAFNTTSNEALCIVAFTTHIILIMEKAVSIHNLKKGRENETQAVLRKVELKYW